jgi:hypothetical protein
MRRLLTLLALPVALSSAYAQNFVAPETEQREIVPEVIIDQRPSVEGIVKDLFTKKPWQMVNPAAPAEYGTGQKFVSKDSGPGTPYHSTGVVVLGVEW